MKILIVHAKSPSLSTVANHLAKVARSMGHDVRVMSDYVHQDFLFYKPDAIIWIEPVNVPMSSVGTQGSIQRTKSTQNG